MEAVACERAAGPRPSKGRYTTDPVSRARARCPPPESPIERSRRVLGTDGSCRGHLPTRRPHGSRPDTRATRRLRVLDAEHTARLGGLLQGFLQGAEGTGAADGTPAALARTGGWSPERHLR